jgi:hypothetical protein
MTDRAEFLGSQICRRRPAIQRIRRFAGSPCGGFGSTAFPSCSAPGLGQISAWSKSSQENSARNTAVQGIVVYFTTGKRVFMSSEMAESPQSFTESQRSLLRDALRSGEDSNQLTSWQRQAIREIRVALGNHTTKPEQLLVAFKGSLTEVANDAKVPLGGERSAVFDRFVSALTEEFTSLNGRP